MLGQSVRKCHVTSVTTLQLSLPLDLCLKVNVKIRRQSDVEITYKSDVEMTRNVVQRHFAAVVCDLIAFVLWLQRRHCDHLW